MTSSLRLAAALALLAAPAVPAVLAAPAASAFALSATFPSNVAVKAVTVDAAATAYAATAGAGVYRLAGGVWAPLPTAGLGSLDVRDVLAVPGTAGVVLAATEGGGIARWAGGVWTTVNATLRSARGLHAMGTAIFATGDEASATPGGTSAVWRSDDGGLTWRRTGLITPTAVEPWALTFAHGTTTMYVATRKGLWTSTDLGATFSPTGFDGNHDDAYDVLAVGTTVLIGTRDGMRRSTDAGATFGPLFSAGDGRDRNIQTFGYDPASGLLFMANNGGLGLRVSSDLGLTFHTVALATTPEYEVDRVFVDRIGGRLFLTGRNGGLYDAPFTTATAAAADETSAGLEVTVAGPNPARPGRAVLRVAATTAALVEVFDTLGRRVLAQDVAAGEALVPVAVTGSGVYFVRTTAGAASQTVRLVVQ